MNDTQQWRDALRNSGGSAGELRNVDEVLRNLRALTSANDAVLTDPQHMKDLLTAAAENAKKADFSVRQRTDTTSDALFLASAEEAPPKYQQQVSDYFKGLSRAGAVAAPAPAASSKGK